MNGDFFSSVYTSLGYLVGLGLPIIIGLLIKDTVLNITAGIQIKLNSNFQYINTFEFETRKNCRIFNIQFNTVEVQDLDTDQILVIFNKDFMKTKIWRNIDKKEESQN